jgi:hypothetical protein
MNEDRSGISDIASIVDVVDRRDPGEFLEINRG